MSMTCDACESEAEVLCIYVVILFALCCHIWCVVIILAFALIFRGRANAIKLRVNQIKHFITKSQKWLVYFLKLLNGLT